MIKTTLIYDHAFWRLKGLSGVVSFGDPPGLQLVDTSMGNGSAPRLTAFLGGPEARRWSAFAAEYRTDLLRGHLRRAFGADCPEPASVSEAIWVDDPWSGGGYNAMVRVGQCRDAVARLRDWPAPIRFAGAELDTQFRGYVEGAICNGQEVGSNVAGSLRGTLPTPSVQPRTPNPLTTSATRGR